MGKIKGKLIKRTAKALSAHGIEFTTEFDTNKRILGNNTMPSKKLRNQIAGYQVRLNRQK